MESKICDFCSSLIPLFSDASISAKLCAAVSANFVIELGTDDGSFDGTEPGIAVFATVSLTPVNGVVPLDWPSLIAASFCSLPVASSCDNFTSFGVSLAAW